MEPIFPSSQIAGITGDRPQEEFTFVAAVGEIDERVFELSNHALVAWEIGLPDDREKVDIYRFAEDFQRYFNVHSLDIQVTKFHPEDFLVNLSSSEVRDAACEVGDITVNGSTYAFRAWDVKLHSSPNALPFHTQGSMAEEGEVLGEQVEVCEDFNAKLDDFIKQVSAALPQPILTAPSKKLTTLFKQPISPSAVKAIKELVYFGGGEVLLKGIEK
ncbi:hypothetical protein GUJ93_ZPchr0001g30870 [Zizania palustris]|uniref:Uncharacterized protein n=1 Tax=Zizania palustris TaxID=103762 RepID=A0A8J5V646_ZIZPA|nr:hypothetical protein GUJ93_ZPchr0001g30870 [Zizania palustris]